MNAVNENTTRVWVLALTSLASAMVALDSLVVTTALSTIRRDLGASIEQLERTVNAYILSFAMLLMTGLGYGALDAGVRLLRLTATLFVVAPLAGALGGRLGEWPLSSGGLALQATGMGWIGTIASPDLSYAKLAAPLVVAGAGVSIAMPAAQSVVLGAVARNEVGKASGMYNMLRFLGGAFGIAIAVVVFSRSGSYGSARAFSDGFAVAIGTAGTLSFLGAVAGLGLAARHGAAVVLGRA